MGAVPAEAVLAVLKQLSHDIRDLDVGSGVDRHQKLPVVQFLRDYVAANKPVILTGVVSHWPAFANWTDEYLCQLAGDTEVTVALTPNGRADAVTPLPPNGSGSGSSSGGGDGGSGGGAAEGQSNGGSGGEGAAQRPQRVFALPHQVKMPLKDFLLLLRSSKQSKLAASGDSAAELAAAQRQAAAAAAAPACPGVVPYLQYQNSSLTAEVPQLLGDVDLLLSWATQAFGGLPEAVNLWIGDERSVTSWHKDPFENIYAVVAGSKTFTLLPPADIYRMRLRQYASATYQPQGGAAADQEAVVSGAVPLTPVLDPTGETVLWSSIPPAPDAKPAAAGAAAAATVAAGIAPGSGPATGNGVRFAVPDPENSRAAGAASPSASEASSEGPGQQLWDPDLFNDPQLPPPIKVTVKAGEALYLPAMWWHHVEQEPDEHGRAIAVNYWYDMKFDARQAYLQAIERLAQLIGLNEEPPAPPEVAGEAEPREGQLRPPYSNRAFG
ncbi:jmjC domain-containing 7 isoform X1 [Chlorella sorokiniana]|uniref:JmjC domain-containing 7 isoform X1 n=1 Tax=Chlorella sorokiniana TaxID=3076 RepID=A0A2P6TXH0_CHLSO|nr:jmjC domain-containing 7 isoform X1 [Chlorella sorokiniana]|eukprot:PRW58748.1 jmjC domain-containing 7 isoform X1 [Chlorella sorokiniana]